MRFMTFILALILIIALLSFFAESDAWQNRQPLHQKKVEQVLNNNN